MRQQHTLLIDFIPYAFDIINFRQIIIYDAAKSILGKLDNSPQQTGFDSSELKYAQFDKHFWVEVTIKNNDVIFRRVSSRRRITPTLVSQWINERVDAINSIGCEILHSEYREGYI